jgi:hypothetical protein
MPPRAERLHDSQRKEHFSYAYVRAICAAAGLAVDKPEADLDSRDLRIYCKGAIELYAQVKCTENLAVHDGEVSFPLPVSDYDHLRAESAAPTILIVVHVPPEYSDWIDQTETQLAMRKCGYWTSLRGQPERSNAESVTVRIPRAQIFSVETPWSILRSEGFECDV